MSKTTTILRVWVFLTSAMFLSNPLSIGLVATYGESPQDSFVIPSSSPNWSQDIRLTFDSQFSIWPSLDTGPQGKVNLAWISSNGIKGGELHFMKVDRTGNILVNDIKLTEMSTYSKFPEIAVDSSGNVHMVWIDGEFSQSEISYALMDSSGSLLIGPTQLSYNKKPSFSPFVDTDSLGHVHIVWREGGPSDRKEILYSKLDPSLDDQDGSPADENVISIVNDKQVELDAFSSRIVIDSQDRIHLSYTKEQEIWYEMIDHNGDPLIDGTRLTFATGPSANPSLTFDSGGLLSISWNDKRLSPYDVIYYTKIDPDRDDQNGDSGIDTNLSVIDDFQISKHDENFSYMPTITSAANGSINIVWTDAGVPNYVYRSRLDSGGNVDIDSELVNAISGHVAISQSHVVDSAIDLKDRIYITWWDDRDGQDEIYFKYTLYENESEPNQPPVADAGPNQTVNEGDTVLFNGTGSFDPDGGAENWKSKTNIPSPRAGGASAVLNGEIYYVGGNSFDLIPGPSSVFQKYNPSTDSWSDLPDLPEPRVFLGAAAVNGRIYAIGGYVGNLSTNTTYEFDPITNNWISKAPIPIPMEAFGTAVVGDKIYLVGGSSTFVWCYPCADVFEYNPSTDSWSKKPDLPTGRARLATAVLDNKIYAIGGDAYVAIGAVEVYDPSTEVWTKRANMTTPRSGLRAEVLGGKIYAFGGIISWDLGVDVNEMYDPLSDNWTSKPSMLDLRMDFGSGVVGNCMYGVGGYRGWMGGHPNSTEEYCLDGELVYEWDVDANVDSDGDGNYTNDVDVSGPAPTHVYGDNGNYTVTLKVTDGSGLWDTDTCIITVLNVPPTADANGPYNGFEGTPIHFNGSHTDPGANDTHTYEWDLSYDGTTFNPDATGNPFQKTWHDDHTGNIALRVTDDDGGWDLDVTTVTIVNVPPIANAGDDKEGYEVSTFTFNGSFYDPGSGDTHTFEWDFDYDGVSFDTDATGQTASHTWTDDFDGQIALRVTDDDGGADIDTAHVLVKNVPPTVTLEVLPIEVDAFLRIAGEKWHDVSIELFEDGVLIANGTLVRYPGSPDDQMLDLSSLQFDHSKNYSATVTYTPDDDPVNGQPNGANPCWIILRFDDGQELWIHHTFNVQHPDTYVWEVDLTEAILSHGMTFEATAFDPGADELAFHWDFGDGTNATSFYSNGNGTYPVTIMEIINHVFPGSGTYTVVLTVQDDDGGVGTASLAIVIP